MVFQNLVKSPGTTCRQAASTSSCQLQKTAAGAREHGNKGNTSKNDSYSQSTPNLFSCAPQLGCAKFILFAVTQNQGPATDIRRIANAVVCPPVCHSALQSGRAGQSERHCKEPPCRVNPASATFQPRISTRFKETQCTLTTTTCAEARMTFN